jgi:cob(I)alamin adenosyltransferase
MKIYTKTGDNGETGLFGGQRVSKDSPRIEAYGTIDEVNSCIGLAVSFSENDKTKEISGWMQNLLFVAGAELASPDTKNANIPSIGEEDIHQAELFIDEINAGLKELTNFILPSGIKSAAALHTARAICRRAERQIVALRKGEKVSSNLLIFINRLSDLLFVLARYENNSAGVQDVDWKSPRG